MGLRSFKLARRGKLYHVTYMDKHLVKHMMQNSNKGLLLFGFGIVFLRNKVLGHLWREITLRQYPMPFQWITLSMQNYVLDHIFALL